MVLESLCVQYDTTHDRLPTTVTTGVTWVVPDVAEVRANAATGLVGDVPR